MAGEDSGEEKTEDPTDHKLREARKKGEIAQSKDLNGAAGFLSALTAVWIARDFMEARIERIFNSALDLAKENDMRHAMPPAMLQMVMDFASICLLFLVPAVLGAVVLGMVQARGIFSADPIKLKFERMNPAEGLKRIFSSRQLFELAKLVLKLALLMSILFVVLKTHLSPLIMNMYSGHERAGGVGVHGLVLLVLSAGLTFVVLALVDYWHQRFEFLKEQRMTKSERKREHKELDGDPFVRAAMRDERQRLMQDSPKGGLKTAQVLITNPTHFAVALYYEPNVVDLPVLVAKGQDALALQMRAQAKGLAIPILENPPLARSLFHRVALGEPIGDEHIEAVAEVFRWLKRFSAPTALV